MKRAHTLFAVLVLGLVLSACTPAAAPEPVEPTVPPVSATGVVAEPTATTARPTATSAPPTAAPARPTTTSAPPTATPPEPTPTTVPATETPLSPSPAPPTAAPTASRTTAPTQKPINAGGDIAIGGQVWMQKPCQGCHGSSAEGRSGPRLAGTSLTFDQVERQVRMGGGRMPPYGADTISDEELRNVYAWLRSLAGQ